MNYYYAKVVFQVSCRKISIVNKKHNSSYMYIVHIFMFLFECYYSYNIFSFLEATRRSNVRFSLLGPAWKSAQRRICLNYLQCTMIHVVRNQIKCILVNERPCDISLAQLRDLICRTVYQSVNRDEKPHSAFQITYD